MYPLLLGHLNRPYTAHFLDRNIPFPVIVNISFGVIRYSNFSRCVQKILVYDFQRLYIGDRREALGDKVFQEGIRIRPVERFVILYLRHLALGLAN